MIRKVLAFVRERTGLGEGEPATVAGGPSFAYTFGWVLMFLIGLQVVTGIALAMFYSPSTTGAWASVAYIQDQATLGWLVRGLHTHGGSAMVIVAGTHLLQTLLRGAYQKPRELTWWLGILLYALVLGWAVTGLVLRWDQAGYAANKVEIAIAAGSPGVGDQIRGMALGGNDYGNLTLTRFYTLHALVMPLVVAIAVFGHVWLARRHGALPAPGRAKARATPRFPEQSIRNAAMMAVALGLLVAYTVSQHGADLGAPADPGVAYSARPLWYFRWLFELRELAGSWDKVAAMAAPAIVGGYFVLIPFLDPRGQVRAVKWGALAMMAIVLLLTAVSIAGDKLDMNAEALGDKARALAIANGVPATGGLDVFSTPPMYKARAIFDQKCKGCHALESLERKGPLLVPGHASRAWLLEFARAPAGDAFWGHTKLGPTDDGMPAFKPDPNTDTDLDAAVELVYAETGAIDTEPVKLAHGKEAFKKMCGDCHSIEPEVAGTSAPALAGFGTRDYYAHFIGNPRSMLHMASPERSQMPRFDKELSVVERDELAGYLVWLRTATKADLDALGPL